MDWNAWFSGLNTLALVGWGVLLLAPRRWHRLGRVPRLAVPATIAVAYTALMAGHFAASGGGYGSLAAVRTLFDSDPLLVAGWSHYLAFDLLVAGWLADRLDAVGVSRLLQAPVLLAVFLFGPAGWLLGLGAEAAARWRAPAAMEA
jgi:hypothetical protein